jgi:RNA polymerase sigma-70 factor (ECF subfamily)
VIKALRAVHSSGVGGANVFLGTMPAPGSVPGIALTASVSLRALFDEHFGFIWRQLRRLGLSDDAADDAAQQVFIVGSRKLDEIVRGRERSFLFGTAMRVASDARRAKARRSEVTAGDTVEPANQAPGADELLDQERARAALDEILAGMEIDLRAVFVLFELEEMTMAAIAGLLELPPGTVASRLRRARAEFRASIKRRKSAGEPR